VAHVYGGVHIGSKIEPDQEKLIHTLGLFRDTPGMSFVIAAIQNIGTIVYNDLIPLMEAVAKSQDGGNTNDKSS
jgi:hypothetical protein